MTKIEMYYNILCLIIAINLVKICSCKDSVEVKLKQGLLSGKVEKTFFNSKPYYSFKGIPYGEPPVGELRFKPPKLNQGWTDLYEAHRDKPTCVQYSSRRRNGEKFGISGSEDCLHLSVYTPDLTGAKAVLVFDYHDNYRTGFNGTKTYSPEFFPEEDIVVVTISHRLGLLGYLTTEDDVIPPNNGLRDYILALQWIKENIKDFGGDPNRVTLMGCKGGGSTVNNLLYSEAAKGLFNSVTMQGGTAHEPIYFPKKPRESAFKLGKLLEIQTDDSSTLLTELQNVDYEKMLTYEADVLDDEEFLKYQLSIYPFLPVIEKDGPEAIITTLPENGKIVNDVPVLIGFNSREGLDLNMDILIEPKLITEVYEDIFVHFPVRTNFRFDRNDTGFAQLKEDILNFYLKHGYLHYGNILEYVVYTADVLENYSLNIAVRKLSKELKSPTFYYMFDFNGHLNENMIFLARRIRAGLENWGASVGDELCYMHVCSRIRDNYEELKKLITEQSEFKVIKRMVRLWSNFAKTGNPTPEEKDDVLKNFIWKPVDKSSEDLAFAHIAKKLKMSANPLGKRETFWDTTLEKYSQLAVDGVVGKYTVAHDEL